MGMAEATREKLLAWTRARKNLQDAKVQVAHDTVTLDNAESDLIDHLLPTDFEEGEKFQIWLDCDGKNRLLVVEVMKDGYSLYWRDERDDQEE